MALDIFVELSGVLLITFVVTSFVKLFKQPNIIGYILSGILAGPIVFDVIHASDTFTVLAHKGVVLLLFMVGLNLNPNVIKEVGAVSVITGIGQVLFTSLVGFSIANFLGFDPITAFYIAVALTFSSTIVIMKLLSDRRDLDSLYGRISIGFLIIQDLIVILLLLGISSFSGDSPTSSAITVIIVGAAVGFGGVFLLAKYFIPRIIHLVAKSQEFLLLFSITWCFAIAAIFHILGFSIEAGALLAGISLSMTHYHHEISSKMKPLRDFFLILFFIVLGAEMVFANVVANIVPILLLSAFVLIGNPIIVMALMGLLGYTKRNSFMSGLTVAQISEFSLIFVGLGVSVGHISSEVVSIVTAIALITFSGSTYLILYSHKIYPVISPYLSIFERAGKKVDAEENRKYKSHDIILFGYNRIGYDILQSLVKIKKRFLIIDFDPETVQSLKKHGYDCVYGDALDTELLDEIKFSKAKMVISTITSLEVNELILAKAKEANPKVMFSAVSHHVDDAVSLYEQGATYVILPHFLGGRHFSTLIENHKLSVNKFLKERIAHVEHITERKKMGHRHPRHDRK